MLRPEPLVDDQVYHVMNKSIAGYKIFNAAADYQRMIQLIRFFQLDAPLPKFSQFLHSAYVTRHGFEQTLQEWHAEQKRHVQIIAYCIMPTHLHLILKPLQKNGATFFLSNILNSYTRYFNTKHNRRGPLWVGRFKNVSVKTDEQLLHLTRYLHLNPVTARIVSQPEKWQYSSYREYTIHGEPFPICQYEGLFEIDPAEYQKFVKDHIAYQRELAVIKKLALE